MSEPGLNFPGKFQSVLGKSKEVGEYLKGHTEASATLAKEAVLVNESNKVVTKFSRELHLNSH